MLLRTVIQKRAVLSRCCIDSRVLIWAQLSRRVAPSAVAATNIADAHEALAPSESTPMPVEPEVKLMRRELTIGGEALAAYCVSRS